MKSILFHNPTHLFNMYKDIVLPSGPPEPHHWKLKNLGYGAKVVSNIAIKESPVDFLLTSPISGSTKDHVLYALCLQLCSNCWLIQKSLNMPLNPEPPKSLSLSSLKLTYFQNIPYTTVFFKRPDNVGVICFRGTTTIHESIIDAKTGLATYRLLPNKSRVPVAYATTLADGFFEKDKRGLSLHTFIESLIEKHTEIKEYVICGHSLGGAWAQLCAYFISQAGKKIVLTSFAPALGSTDTFCSYAATNFDNITVINASDIVPRLSSRVSNFDHCCPLLVIDVAKSSTFRDRAMSHDMLMYLFALLEKGSFQHHAGSLTCNMDIPTSKELLYFEPIDYKHFLPVIKDTAETNATDSKE